MTRLEADQFVTDEIAARYKTLPDATRGDWTRAVLKAGDVTLARRIVQEIADDPEATLNVKAFYRRLKASGQGRPEGKATFAVRDGGEFVVCAVATWPDGAPWWTMPIKYPTHRRYDNGVLVAIPWTADKLMEAMQPILREIRSAYGGEWFLKIEQAKPEPEPEFNRKRVPRPELKSTPKPEPPDGRKVKEMVDRMMAEDRRRKLPEKATGYRFDPDNDPELQGDI